MVYRILDDLWHILDSTTVRTAQRWQPIAANRRRGRIPDVPAHDGRTKVGHVIGDDCRRAGIFPKWVRRVRGPRGRNPQACRDGGNREAAWLLGQVPSGGGAGAARVNLPTAAYSSVYEPNWKIDFSWPDAAVDDHPRRPNSFPSGLRAARGGVNCGANSRPDIERRILARIILSRWLKNNELRGVHGCMYSYI